MKRFKDNVIVITGGASGIGKAASIKFAQEGAHVIIWDMNEAKCEEIKSYLTSKKLSCTTRIVNTTDPEAVELAAKELTEQYARIDVLINNAGITRDATIKKMTYNDWSQVIDVNLNGVFNCIKATVPLMIEAGYGRIINTSSVVGLYGNFGQTNYASTKSGLIGMSKTLAKELGKYNITVNAVAPGFILTEMVQKMPEKVIQMMHDKTPLGRLGTPDDVANAYAFLASQEASFISGSVLSVDGAVSL